MAFFIEDKSFATSWPDTSTVSRAYAFINGQDPLASPSYGNNPTVRGAKSSMYGISANFLGESTYPKDSLFSGEMAWMATQHTDFNFRLWVLPPEMRLINPQIDSNISFNMWNTNPRTEVVTDVDIDNSDVLSFDISVSDSFHGFEYKSVNLQISEGEPTINSEITFSTTNLAGTLNLVALISDTFKIIPEIPVTETWEYKTDIITNFKGREQRVSLIKNPRIKQKFSSIIETEQQRLDQYDIIRRNLSARSIVPFYQYATNLTQSTTSSQTRLYFNPVRSNVRVGEYVIVVNSSSQIPVIGRVETINSDGVTLTRPVGTDLDKSFIVAPTMNCLINDGSGLSMNSVSGSLDITADSFSEFDTLRPDATREIDTFDDLPFLDRRPRVRADEGFSYRKYILDGGTGVRNLSSGDLHAKVSGSRLFTIQRISDPDEMDYWRSFFETIRGGQGGFLMSTWFPDLSLSSGQSDVSGLSSIEVDEDYYTYDYFPFETWNRIQIEYSGGLTSQHSVTSSRVNDDSHSVLGFTPSIPDSSEYASPTKISFLMKWRATDRVVFKHFANYTEISFGVFSSD